MNADTATHTESIALEYALVQPPAKVWRALTEQALLSDWLMNADLQPDMELVLGLRFTFKAQPTPWWDGIVNCQVLELELHRRLRYSWQSGPPAAPLDTVVTWTLAPAHSGGSRLGLQHSGFLPENALALDGARDGWRRMVGERLPAVLALPGAGRAH